MKLTEKQLNRNIKDRLWAAEELLKRLMPCYRAGEGLTFYKADGEIRAYNKNLHWTKEQQHELVIECLTVIGRVKTTIGSKRAARTLLKCIFGEKKTTELIEDMAVVEDRNDSLVRRWRNKVIERDKSCKGCGSTKGLHARHINHWCEDPVNRVNVDNGIALCAECHAKEHPEISGLIMSRLKAGETNG